MSDIVGFLEYVEPKIESYLGNDVTNIVIIVVIILVIIFGAMHLCRTFFPKNVAPSSHNSGISFGDNAKIGGNVTQKGKE